MKDPDKTVRDENYNVWDEKNTLDGIKQRLDLAEEKISEFEDMLVETGEGDGTPLQYSCLENPMDGGAW